MDRTSQYHHYCHFNRQENKTEDDKDAEEYSKAEGVFEESQTGRCGVSYGGIGVSGPKDHYSNPPTVSSLPFVRSSS